MAQRVKSNRAILEVLQKAKPNLRKAIIQASDKEIVHLICEVCENLLLGNIPLSPEQKIKLKKYRTQIRKLAQRGDSVKKKKEILLQRGGALPLLPILISALGSVLPLLLKS